MLEEADAFEAEVGAAAAEGGAALGVGAGAGAALMRGAGRPESTLTVATLHANKLENRFTPAELLTAGAAPCSSTSRDTKGTTSYETRQRRVQRWLPRVWAFANTLRRV
jgi:hypothetical protein